MARQVSPRQRAAKKAAKTRHINRMVQERYEQFDKPAYRRAEILLNRLLRYEEILVHFTPPAKMKMRLMGGVEHGKIVRFLHGGKTWRVLPDGYKRPVDFHASFWGLMS